MTREGLVSSPVGGKPSSIGTENEWKGGRVGRRESVGTNGEKGVAEQSGYRVSITAAENHRNGPGKTISIDRPLSVKR